MKTDTIALSWGDDAFERAVALSEMVAKELRLDAVDADIVTRLTEETLSMIDSIFGKYEGELHFDLEGKKLALITEMEKEIVEDLKEVLIRMSSSGKNDYKQSLLDKIAGNIKNFVSDNGISRLVDEEDKEDVFVIRTKDGEVWEESEKAILQSYSDEVRVSIKGSKIIIKVLKDFVK